MLLARLRATHRPQSPHISLPLSLSPSLAHTRPPLALRKPASHDHPRPLTCCSPHLAAQLVSNLSLPSAALTAARFRHPPRSSVERATQSQIACIPALSTRALQSCPRVLDMNIIRNPRCEERPAVVSKGDSRRSLFGSFDICAASV